MINTRQVRASRLYQASAKRVLKKSDRKKLLKSLTSAINLYGDILLDVANQLDGVFIFDESPQGTDFWISWCRKLKLEGWV